MFDLKLLIFCCMAMLLAFLFTVLMAPGVIRKLRIMKFGQEVRNDGPETHLKKQGTPTMGGIVFLTAIILSVIAVCAGMGFDGDALLILLLAAGYGFTGFLDDFLKIRKHQSEGLKARQKLLIQFVFVAAFTVLLCVQRKGSCGIIVPFTGLCSARSLLMPLWLFVPFVFFVVLGTDNGVNFTDGLDGLCSSVTIIVSLFFVIVGLIASPGTAVVSAAVAGALMGFLIFNVYPAKVFMGDTGSLALGGYIAASAVITGTELYLPIVGFIYMAEVLSVIIQVLYFKKTGGKRFFKMAPIHHHFEKLGNPETRIVSVFTIVTVLLCSISLIGILI